MQVESYRSTSCDISSLRRENSERTNIVKEIGLDKQVALVGDADLASSIYEELRGYTLAIWQNFLPTFYSRNDGKWSQYVYDVIPLRALTEIKTALHLSVFDDLELWTPEHRTAAHDPMAVGVIGTRSAWARFFPIARWGDALWPFEQIERTVQDSKIAVELPDKIRHHAWKLLVSNPKRQIYVYEPRSLLLQHHWGCGGTWYYVWMSDKRHGGVQICDTCDQEKRWR